MACVSLARCADWWWRGRILAAQDDDFDGAHVVKERLTGFLYLVGRYCTCQQLHRSSAFAGLTEIQLVKCPVATQETAIRLLRLLLSDTQIDLVLFRRHARSG